MTDGAVLQFAAGTLIRQHAEVVFWRLVSDGDVDLALHQHVIRNLIVLRAVQAFGFQVATRINVMHVAAMADEISDGNILRQISSFLKEASAIDSS